MIFNMSGGGGTAAGLNFKVVGGTSVPSNPTANTIWVNTGASITSWHFGAKEPNVWEASIIDASDLCGLRVNRTLSDGDILNITIPATVDVSWLNAIRISDISGNLYYVRNSDGTAISSWAAGNKVGLRISNTKYPINGQGNNGGSAIVVASNGYYHDAGTVWISTSTSSTAPFNPLKKNNITVYPMSAKQYVNGAWVNKTAKTYQGGKWVDWIVYVVPSNTFSWFTNNTVRGNVTKNNDNSVTVKCTSTNYYVMAFTKETFDLTGFNKMIVTYTSTSGYTMAAIGVATSTTGTEAYNEYIAYTKVNRTSTPVTATINISNINRPVYFGATEFNGSITIKEIRLEV